MTSQSRIFTDPKFPSRPTTKAGNRKGQNNVSPPPDNPTTILTKMNMKVAELNSKQSSLGKFVSENINGSLILQPAFLA